MTKFKDSNTTDGKFEINVRKTSALVATVEVTNTETEQKGTLTCLPDNATADAQVERLKKSMEHA